MTSKIRKIIINRDNKAQVDAPFEVLVAVILMGFVILAGSYALRNLSQNICIGEKRQDISDFKNALRDVVLGSDLTYKNFYLRPKYCFNSDYETTRIVTYTDPHRCSAYCHTPTPVCTLIEYYYDDGKISRYPITPVCTDLPSAISFEDKPGICGINEEGDSGEVLIQQEGSAYIIEPGYYRIFRVSVGRQTKVCVVRKIN